MAELSKFFRKKVLVSSKGEIYFHEHSVLESGFAGLKVGTEVHFVEEAGEKGPQASTVMPVKHHDMKR